MKDSQHAVLSLGVESWVWGWQSAVYSGVSGGHLLFHLKGSFLSVPAVTVHCDPVAMSPDV